MIADINERYILACWAYSIGEPIISDIEFDALRLRLMKTNQELANTSWSDINCPAELLRKHEMKDLIRKVVLSADKTSSMESINDVESVHKEYYGHDDDELNISVKCDGWNIQIFYFDNKLLSGKTRGRKTDFMSVDNLLPYLPQKISVGGKVRITGEAVLTDEGFAAMQSMFPSKELTSPRAAVSSALSSPEAAKHLTFLAFRFEEIGGGEKFNTKREEFSYLTTLGFNTPCNINVKGYDLLPSLENFSYECGAYENYSDGAVIACPGKDLKAVRVFRWAQQYYQTHVVGYEQEWGPSEISTKLKVEPVYIGGSTHTTLDIDNPARIKELNLKVGSPVAFTLISHAVEKILPEMTMALQEAEGFE